MSAGEGLVVAIDGPAGSGKSTVARAVAARLGLEILETGAMYRAVAVAVLDQGVATDSEVAATAAALISGLSIEVKPGERVRVNGVDVSNRVRSPEVARIVSSVAAEPAVRAELVRHQRAWVAGRAGAVVEGRDIGSVVFPDATLKVYLTASAEERARRRGDEDAAAIARRDHLDSSRAASPLTVPDDAVLIDSTDRSVDDIADEIVRLLAGVQAAGR